MQPCAVCGSVTIDAAGYCVRCGTLRGVPGQSPRGGYPAQPQYPGYGQPAAGPAYGPPSSGGPGYPMSGGPGYPTSGTPGYPTSAPPAGYAPGYPSAPVPPKRSMMVPLIALAATLVVLVTGIGVVLAVRGDDDPKTEPTPIAGRTVSPEPTQTSSVPEGPASCVIGTWNVTSHEEETNNEDLGRLIFQGGQGATVTYTEDGAGRTDYGDGTEYETTYQGKSLILEIEGYVTYSYDVTDKKIKMSDVKSSATFRLVLDGEQVGQRLEFDASADEANYTCSGDRMTQKTILYTTEFARS